MDDQSFRFAEHTLVVSDIHLADAEPVHPQRPLWKRFKRPRHFIDRSFKNFLDHMQTEIQAPIELILNGDIFDFDSMMKLPDYSDYKITWLEKLRGLSSEEQKSRFKMKMILADHSLWIESLRHFVLNGNRIVFIIGNHDIELHWLSVRKDLLDALSLPPEFQSKVRFCEWFYISNQDTLIEHGNQYDAYCLCSNPIHPLIKKGSKVMVRLPFGNLAGKFMINGIGLMNPHATTSFIKSTFWEYIVFYYRYVMRMQPLLLWTWLWGAFVTLTHSLVEGFLPAVRDPLTVDKRIEDIAYRSNAPILTVLALKEIQVHPAIFNPFKIMRELWLDRAVLLLLMFLVSFQFFSFLNVFSQVSFWWFVIPNGLFLPIFIFYARSVQSEVDVLQNVAFDIAPLTAQIAKVKRIVQGHTHLETHTQIDNVEILNTGTWSPAFYDVECTQPYGRKCFALISPDPNSAGNDKTRYARLYEWDGAQAKLIHKK